MAFLVEQAGGRALSGNQRTLDVVPESVHQRVPCILGSPDDVNECYKYYEEYPSDLSPVSTHFETSWM